MTDTKASLLWFAKAIALVCAGIFSIAAVLAVASAVIVGGLQAYQFADSWLESTSPFIYSSDADQNSDMRSNRGAIQNWVLACTKTQSLRDVPAHIQRLYNSSSLVSSSAPKEFPPGVRPPNRRELAIISLSSTISLQRTLLRDKVRAAYSWWQWTSIVTILLGLVTTIVVSLSSTKFFDETLVISKWIRGAAIGLPAIGTAAAAFVAFYSPQAEWAQSSRTLASLSQLHGQIALGVWKQKCLEDDARDDAFDAVIDEWSKRYNDIQTVAVSAQQGNASASGQGGTPAKQDGAPHK